MPESGMLLTTAPAIPPALPDATVLDRSDESPTTVLYRAAVGPISADYYPPIFSRFDSANRVGATWNWAASLYTLNWMAFRHLWLAALVYVGAMVFVPLLVFGIGRLVWQLSDTAEISLLLGWVVLSFGVPGLMGNALLHTDIRKKMTRAITGNPTLAQACDALLRQASSRQRLIGLGLVNLLLVGAAVGAYLAVPNAGVLPLTPPAQALRHNVDAGRVADLSPIPAIPAMAAMAASATPSKPTQPASAPLQPASSPTVVPVLAVPVPIVAPATSTRFHINVGVFAKATTADKAQSTVQEAGLAVYTQELDTAKGKRTRVRVGPFDTQPEADAAAEKIRTLKLDAVVFQQ